MPLRRNFLLSVGMLLACNVLLAFGSIGLLTRMSPAIERILRENVSSDEAVEYMLVLLAQAARERPSDARQKHFEQALQRARKHVTEPEEVSVLEHVAQWYGAASQGIHLSRDNLSSIAYSEELIFSMSATLQSTDRRHGIVG